MLYYFGLYELVGPIYIVVGCGLWAIVGCGAFFYEPRLYYYSIFLFSYFFSYSVALHAYKKPKNNGA